MPTEEVYWAILANVDQEQQRLLAEARAVEAQVRLVHFEARDRRDSSEWGTYLPYVRELASGVACNWAVVTFYGPQTKRKMRLQEFGRRQKYRYSPSQFPNAKEWEIGEIIRAENVFERIRRRTALLGSIVQLVKGTGSAEGVAFTKEPPEDRAAQATDGYQSVLKGWQSPGRLNAVSEDES